LIVNGFLCPLTSKASVTEFDLSAVKVRGGEFVESEMQAAMGENEELVRSACAEMVAASQDRKACLVFAAGVEHAWQIERILRGMGESCEVVTGETDSNDRREVLDEFRGGSLKWLVNVNVLTTGFDARHIDMIAILRATMSPGLWYQMCGRGLRIHESKRNCLVLDFGSNASRHGPIDQIKRKTKRAGDGEAPAKTCPDCREVVAAGCAVCPECWHEFPREEKPRNEANAGKSGVISGEITDTVHDVKRELFGVHHKRGADEGAPKTMRVEYEVGFHAFVSEWICIEHSGFARSKAYKWWKARTDLPFPASAADAVTIAKQGLLRPAKQITVREIAGQKFSSVIEHVLDAEWAVPVTDQAEESQPKTCRECGVCDFEIGPGAGPHAARESCANCGAFVRWVSKSEAGELSPVGYDSLDEIPF
jgi:DNA repair protein RadD